MQILPGCDCRRLAGEQLVVCSICLAHCFVASTYIVHKKVFKNLVQPLLSFITSLRCKNPSLALSTNVLDSYNDSVITWSKNVLHKILKTSKTQATIVPLWRAQRKWEPFETFWDNLETHLWLCLTNWSQLSDMFLKKNTSAAERLTVAVTHLSLTVWYLFKDYKLFTTHLK